MLVAGLDRGQLHEIFHALALSRAADERLRDLLGEGLVKGAELRCLGHEGGAVGSAYALRRRTDGTGDIIAPSAGATGAVFLLGGTPLELFRQHLARATGPTGGRHTRSHWTDLKRGLLETVSPPGIMLEVMAGITLSFRLRGEDRVGIVYGGEGATATGAWHEGLNFAAVQRCPLVLVTDAIGDPLTFPSARETRVQSFLDKAPGYGIAAESVDGHDVLAVFEATRRAADHARSGAGVTLLELRYPHSLRDASPANRPYLVPDGVKTQGAEDPIERFRRRLIEERWATPGELNAIAARAEADIRRAAEQALEDPSPVGEDAIEGVYTDDLLERPWSRLPHPFPTKA